MASHPEPRPTVRTFRACALRLGASFAAALDDSNAENVRYLRACGRHLSAQIQLFKLTEVVSHRKVATKHLKHLLKKMAKASSKVRRLTLRKNS
jgi:hypothetical protein